VALIALVAAAAGGLAAAAPSAQLLVSGECPARAEMEAALTGVVELLERGDWSIAIEQRGDGARMTLRGRGGVVAFERKLVSADCRAMAGAFAVMLHGFFRQLAGDVPAGTSGAEPRVSELRVPEPRVPDARHPPVPALAGQPAAGEGRLDLGLSAGTTLSDGTTAAMSGSFEGGWRLARRLTARVRFHGDAPRKWEGELIDERIEIQGTSLAIGLGLRLDRGRLWLRPALLAGAAAWRADAIGIENPPLVRVHPFATGLTAAGVRLAEAVSLRVEVGQTLFLRRDRYLVMPDLEVARSPRTALSVEVGVECAIFP
jgi:hypothetical protein